MEQAIARILPHMSTSTAAVWSSWSGDPHRDHGSTARLAQRLVARNPMLTRWSYPIWGRFDPDAPDVDSDALVLFDIHPWHDRKAAAIAVHASQMSGLIVDDPGGFRMTEAHQRHFRSSPEIFLRESSR